MSNLSSFVKSIRDVMRNDAGINGDAQRLEQIVWMLFLKVYDAKEDDWEMDYDNYQSIIPNECRWRNWAKEDQNGHVLTGDPLLEFVNNKLFPTLKNLPVNANTPIQKSIVQAVFADANNYMKDGVLLRQVVGIIDSLDLYNNQEVHAFGEIYETLLKSLQSAGSAGEFYTPRAVTDFMARMINPQIGEKMADFACGTGGFITSWLKELEKKVKTTADRDAYDNSIYGVEKKQFPYMLCITNMLLHDLENPNIIHGNSLISDVLDYTDKERFDVILMNPPYGGSEKKDVQGHFPNDLASSETADLFMAVIMYRLKKDGRAAVVLPDGFLFSTDDSAKVNLKKKLLNEFNLHTVIRLPASVFAPYTSITTNILFFDKTHQTESTWFYRLDMPEGYKHFSKTKPMRIEHFAEVESWWNDRKEIEIEGSFKAKEYSVQELIDNQYNIDLCGFPHEVEEILEPNELISRYEESRSELNRKIDNILEQIKTVMESKD